jgi:hypothetical protein
MTELDCPTCHQRYTIPKEMKNHVEQVHKVNGAYIDTEIVITIAKTNGVALEFLIFINRHNS